MMLTTAKIRQRLTRRVIYLILGTAVSIVLVLSYIAEVSLIANSNERRVLEIHRKKLQANGKERGSESGREDSNMTLSYIAHQREEWLKAEQGRANRSFDVRPGSSFMRQQRLIQRERKQGVRAACRRYPQLTATRFNVYSEKNMFAMDKNRLLYCSVPKTGCTNWKKVLLVLEGAYKHTWNIIGQEAHHPKGSSVPRRVWDMTSSERNYIMHTYVKFMYVRHPFVRLISAYRNKIDREIANQDITFQKYCREIISKHRPGADLGQLEASGHYGVTWAEWVRYLTDPSQLKHFNPHWMEYYKICLPCRIQYDFIGKLETVEADSSYMLGLLGIDGISYPISTRVKSTDLYQQYFGNVSQRDLRKLWQIYKYDFELFGFQKPKELEEGDSAAYSLTNKTDLMDPLEVDNIQDTRT